MSLLGERVMTTGQGVRNLPSLGSPQRDWEKEGRGGGFYVLDNLIDDSLAYIFLFDTEDAFKRCQTAFSSIFVRIWK